MTARSASRIWLRWALLNLFVAASLGVLLRFAFVQELLWLKFRYVLHAHSHTAMLGWAYPALVALLVRSFLPDTTLHRAYSWLFWLGQVAVLGMLLSFPVQGYGPVSIACSTLHMLVSYGFAWQFGRDLRQAPPGPARWTARAALYWMVGASLGLWAMGPVIVLGLQGSTTYYMAVQFFLHFQFNGWYLFAVLAVLLRYLEDRGWSAPPRAWRRVALAGVPATLLTYALALTWANPDDWLFWLNGLGVLLQLLAFVLLWQTLRSAGSLLPRQGWAGVYGYLAGGSLLGKVLIQTAVVVPAVATVAYTIRNLVVGFLHLILLGVLTHFIWAAGHHTGLLDLDDRRARWGMALFTTGFVASELVIFLQGTMFWGNRGFLPFYYEGLFAISLLMPLGVLAFAWAQWQSRT
ncbi:MAG: hypothetical protein OHK0039_21230 [Bacteroidia bacterium]